MDAGLADGATTRDLVLEQASNPASRLGRFTRTAKSTEKKGVSLTTEEVQTFLDAASEICPEYYPLFLTAFRAGLRRGELVALQMGDLNFGKDENDLNRYLFVQHNYVHREHTSTKSKKARRVDMSKDLPSIPTTCIIATSLRCWRRLEFARSVCTTCVTHSDRCRFRLAPR